MPKVYSGDKYEVGKSGFWGGSDFKEIPISPTTIDIRWSHKSLAEKLEEIFSRKTFFIVQLQSGDMRAAPDEGGGRLGNKRDKREDPIEKLKEWQDNQYNPGYYTGGKIPPYVGIPSKTSLFGKLYKIGARIVGVIYILMGATLICIAVTGVILVWKDCRGMESCAGVLVAGAIVCGVAIFVHIIRPKVY